MGELVDQGLVRAIGMSNYALDDIERCHEQRPVDATMLDALPRFTVKLLKNGQLAAEGSGRNVLRSPAACLAELAVAASRAPHAEPLAGGEIISTGTTTESQPIATGETWIAELDGLALPSLTVRVTS